MVRPDRSRKNPWPIDPRVAIAVVVVVVVVVAVLVLGLSTGWATGVHIVLGVMQLITCVNQSIRPPRRRCGECGAEL